MISARRSIACGFSILAITRGAAADHLLGFDHVVGALHEGQRNPVDAGDQRRLEVGAVLRRHRRDRQVGVGQADALAVGHPAADHDAGHRVLLRGLLRDQPHLAVVEQQRVAGPQRGQDLPDAGAGRAWCRPASCRNRA